MFLRANLRNIANNLRNIVTVEKQRSMCRLLNFFAEYNFLSLLAAIWIENRFPLKGPIIDFFRSLFNSIADVFISCITENKEVSLANSLAFDDKRSDKSLT